MLTVLQEKLADAHGLAIAASVVTANVAERVSDPMLLDGLSTLRADAEETRARCVLLERALAAEVADEVRARAGDDARVGGRPRRRVVQGRHGPLRAWTFLAMGEAAEVAAWEAVGVLAVRADAGEVAKLAAWALPIQKRHLAFALDGVVALAEGFDPVGPRWG